MTRSVRLDGPQRAIQAAHLYLTARLDRADAARDMGDKKRGPYADVAAWCRNFGEQDENGSYTWLLGTPLTIDGITYSGFRLQARHPAPYWKQDEGRAFIDALPAKDKAAVTRTEIVYEYDDLWLLVQQNRIPAAALDPLIETPPVEYSLTVLEGKDG